MIDPLAELLAQVTGALLQTVFEQVFGATRDWAHHRRLARHLVSPEVLLRRIEPTLATLRGQELATLPDHEWAAAVHAVRDTLALVTPIEPARGYQLLLVDGLDELTPGCRLEALRWLGELVTAYSESRFVVTSRPPPSTGRGSTSTTSSRSTCARSARRGYVI